MQEIGLIIAGVALVIVLYIIITYNKLVSSRNKTESCFAGIDVQLKKRYDLVPQLVQSVKGYMQHEEKLFNRLTEIRNTPFTRLSEESKLELDDKLSQAADSLRIHVESYPQLKSSDNVLLLQRSLNETEEQLAAARRSYNAAVLRYTTLQMSFPSNLVANMFGFKKSRYFEASNEARQTPNTSF